MKKKIHNCKDLFFSVCQKNNKYIDGVRKNGGISFHLRALMAQVLWFLFFYNLGLMLIPVKDWLISSTIVIAILAFCRSLRIFIDDKFPSWIDDFIKGKFFYDFGISFLNKWILILFFLVVGQMYFNNNQYNEKLYGRGK